MYDLTMYDVRFVVKIDRKITKKIAHMQAFGYFFAKSSCTKSCFLQINLHNSKKNRTFATEFACDTK